MIKMASYESQLAFLRNELADETVRHDGLTVTERKNILLSLAESVKSARDHNLNCSALPTPPGS